MATPHPRDGRPSARARGYDNAWQRASRAFLAKPGNQRCACGCGQVANMVHHEPAHKGDMRKFWDKATWRPFNRACNSRVAAEREGAFGNRVQAGPGYSSAIGNDGLPVDPAHPFHASAR